MGQKLERMSGKDEESQDNSDCSEQTGDTRLSENADPDESKHPDHGSSATHWGIDGIRGFSVTDLAMGKPKKLTVTSARTDPQTEQPIRPVGQQEHLLRTKGEWVGRGRERFTPTVWESKRVPSFKETNLISNKKRSFEYKAVARSGSTAMDDQENQNTSETNSKIDPQTQSRCLTTSCNPSNEEDFVLLEKDGTWMSSEAESSSKREVGNSDNSRNDKLPQPSRHTPRDGNNKKLNTERSDTVGACAESSPRDCLKREMGQHLAELTGSRCRLKGVSHVACSETSGGGTAETEQNIGAQIKQELTQSKPKDQQVAREDRFAEIVSLRSKSGVSAQLLNARKDESQSHPPRSTTPPSVAPQLHPPEQCEAMPCPPLAENTDRKVQVACLKKESELVCFSAVVTPPTLTHLLPRKDTTMTEAMPISSGPNSDLMPTENIKVKGPPPPVPKKPKNPFVKLKTAQLKSTDVQRREKDHLRSEERVKRRHTFHFNKGLPCSKPTNQDMCLLWNERGTYIVPANVRRLSADIRSWDHLSPRHIDDQSGDVVNFEYCLRMAELSPQDEPQNLDMLQRRVFLDRRSKRSWSSPPVNTTTEAFHTPDDAPNSDFQSLKYTISDQKETGLLSEIMQKQVSEANHGDYSCPKKLKNHSINRDAGQGGEVGSYKPVAEIVKEANQMQRQQSQVRPEAPKAPVRLAEQTPSTTVSQMKNTFDVPKKSKERPADVQTQTTKKGKSLVCF